MTKGSKPDKEANHAATRSGDVERKASGITPNPDRPRPSGRRHPVLESRMPTSGSFALAHPSSAGEPVVLSEKYLADIARVESLVQNQSGSDKTWVEKALRDAEAHLARAKRVR